MTVGVPVPTASDMGLENLEEGQEGSRFLDSPARKLLLVKLNSKEKDSLIVTLRPDEYCLRQSRPMLLLARRAKNLKMGVH